jgi:hypothetical protein
MIVDPLRGSVTRAVTLLCPDRQWNHTENNNDIVGGGGRFVCPSSEQYSDSYDVIRRDKWNSISVSRLWCYWHEDTQGSTSPSGRWRCFKSDANIGSAIVSTVDGRQTDELWTDISWCSQRIQSYGTQQTRPVTCHLHMQDLTTLHKHTPQRNVRAYSSFIRSINSFLA